MNKVDELLTRGVANIIPGKKELKKLLDSGKKLNIYMGIDPTATHIHLGHAVPLRKLQSFVDLGHKVTFLIGDFTALVGDTSDKESERPILTPEEIEANFQTYKQQASKILDFDSVMLRHNSEWLSKLSLGDVIKLAYNFSAGDFYSRELIKKRLQAGTKVGLHELLYPLMQGYDSYFLDTDIQLGGTDQTFNMQAGRTLQKSLRDKQSFVMTNEFLTGTDGRKMSKSWGNAIWLDDEPSEVYGKVMSLRDELILEYFMLGTALDMDQVDLVKKELKATDNPMSLKKKLAWEITKDLNGHQEADLAEKKFEQVHQQGNLPSDMRVFKTDKTEWNPVGLLVESGLCSSKSSARRLIEQGGVKVDNKKFSDLHKSVIINNQIVIKIGKIRFVKILINK